MQIELNKSKKVDLSFPMQHTNALLAGLNAQEKSQAKKGKRLISSSIPNMGNPEKVVIDEKTLKELRKLKKALDAMKLALEKAIVQNMMPGSRASTKIVTGLVFHIAKTSKTIDQLKSKKLTEQELAAYARRFIKEVMELLTKVQVIITQMQLHNLTSQQNIEKLTVKLADIVSNKQIQKTKEALKEFEEMKHKSGIFHILSIFTDVLMVAIGCMMGFGAAIMMTALVVMNETGAMNKICGNNMAAKVGFSLAAGLATGGVAAAADGAMFSAEAVGEEATENVGEDEAANSGKLASKADAAKASMRFVSINMTTNLLIQSGLIQNGIEKAFGKNTISEALNIVVTIAATIAALLAAGPGGSQGGIARQLASGSDMGTTNLMTKLMPLLQTIMIGTTIAQMVERIQMSQIQKEQAKTTKELAPVKGLAVMAKLIESIMTSMQHMVTSQIGDEAKQNGQDIKDFGAIAKPWAQAARVLAGAA